MEVGFQLLQFNEIITYLKSYYNDHVYPKFKYIIKKITISLKKTFKILKLVLYLKKIKIHDIFFFFNIIE